MPSDRDALPCSAAVLPSRLASTRELAMPRPPHPPPIHGWLLLLPAMALLALFTHWPAVATFIDSFYSTPRPRPPGALRRPRELRGRSSTTRCSGRRSANNLLVRARHHSGLDRARHADGAVGQRPHRRAHARAHGVFHADRAADDRGREHLAVLLHAAIRPARADHRRVRRRLAQLARLQGHGARSRSRSWRSGRRPASS